MSNGWVRMECSDGFSERSEQLLANLRNVENSFVNILPSINSSIPVFPEQFNYSGNL